MDFSHKVLHLLHDGDSYEIIVNSDHRIREIWRYNGNKTCKPEFVRLDWLDEIIQDRIYDRIVREFGEVD